MNPYWHEPLVLGTTVIDYSQPIVVVEGAEPQAEMLPADDPVVSQAMAQFDLAREAFARGDYAAALQLAHRALEQIPDDAVLHEFVAMVHFAQGNYHEAAGTVHAVLAAGPAWNWETVSALYSDVSIYTRHLRAAEAYRNASPEAAYVRFLLAYHYLTAGHEEAAADQLRKVLELEPGDTVAAQLLQELTGEAPAAATPAPAATGVPSEAGTVPDSLAGSWKATSEDGSEYALTLSDEGEFTWTFTREDQTSELTGTYSLVEGQLVLESEESGTMSGRVSQRDDNRFQFHPAGAPEEDPGLLFEQ